MVSGFTSNASLFLCHAVLELALYTYIADGVLALVRRTPAAMQHAYQQSGAERCAAELRDCEQRVQQTNARTRTLLLLLVVVLLVPIIVGLAFLAVGFLRPIH